MRPARRRRRAGVVAVALVVSTLLPAGTALANQGKRADAPGQNKVAVCHIDETGAYGLKEISPSALEAHLRHGDLLPGGAELDGSCVPWPDDNADFPGKGDAGAACQPATGEEEDAFNTFFSDSGVVCEYQQYEDATVEEEGEFDEETGEHA